MITIKIHCVKKYKNSGNKIRSNQNQQFFYIISPTKEEFETLLHNTYGKRAKYKILSGSFNDSAALHSNMLRTLGLKQ